MQRKTILRLILGDQLNINHSWFKAPNPQVLYLMMEMRQETDYVAHHIQKIAGFFATMRCFAAELENKGHDVKYFKIDDSDNTQLLVQNIERIININNIEQFQYQEPDEYRLDIQLTTFCKKLNIKSLCVDSEHFYSTRTELGSFFKGKKQFLMESFYRHMRVKHHILMDGPKPEGGEWNFDKLNREKYNGQIPVPEPISFKNNLIHIKESIENHNSKSHEPIQSIGEIAWEDFNWPIDREQALLHLDYFVKYCLPHFGTYEDAMSTKYWSLFHSRLSFALNIKLLTPNEVIDSAVGAWHNSGGKIEIRQIEGFVRQIVGWREYMRGIYWNQMPEYEHLNFFNHQSALPQWFWNGNTKMNCLKLAITGSLQHAYAHHIQRLMIAGNFVLLAGVHPDEVDRWYLGIYIDAIQWVEITNTRGMSQYADGGIVGTKPYVSSANYIDKMSDYCAKCYYAKNLKYGERACPFNSLYWHFYHRNEEKLAKNPRIGMMYVTWKKMPDKEKNSILAQAEKYLSIIDEL